MPLKNPPSPPQLSLAKARAIWIDAQRLNSEAPFGAGPKAVQQTIEHLGYVQIDTINVIERCHHHILYNRIPDYQRADLHDAQSISKTVFEYWTHALSFVPTRDYHYFLSSMLAHRQHTTGWGAHTTPQEIREILKRIEREGPLAISDIKDDTLVDKTHLWASRKPSKRALQAAFYNGLATISRREGMLKIYDLTARHFGWENMPKPANSAQINLYKLTRALNAQGIVSLDSICHLAPKDKPAIAAIIDKQVKTKQLLEIKLENDPKSLYWCTPETLEKTIIKPSLTHILSPFDPLMIIRKRTAAFFNYAHLFEAYVPAAKRKLGYFTLPVLMGDKIVAAIDLKADRQAQKLLIQNWHWVGIGNAMQHLAAIEKALEKFETFQFAPHDKT